MLLKKILDLKSSIDESRKLMDDLVKDKEYHDPEVVKVTQELDGQIVLFKNFLCKINVHTTESSI